MIVPPSAVSVPVGELSLGQVETLAHSSQAGAGVSAGGEAGSFGGELTEAISSLEKTQDSASSASQALATGTVSDPESAIVTVEDAQMAMELASQLRNKATEATTSIFNTQV
ncbi:MAG: flagellar hook-basal body complex protein FliE [Solirubrobacteraceae bacterium]